MDDKPLMKLSLIISAAGFVLLLLTLTFIQPQEVAISGINANMVGSFIKVIGAVESISSKSGDVFVTLEEDGSKIDVIVFSRTASDFPLVYDAKEGDTLTVSGKVSLYKSRLEIIADSVEF